MGGLKRIDLRIDHLIVTTLPQLLSQRAQIRNLLKGLSLYGGLEKTRTSDLFRVKEAL
jgi:hypothetical protein